MDFSSTSPIGIFDSGIGGLSVWREVHRLIPNESVVYFADQAYCPYGPRTQEVIQQRACRITDFLIGQGCKLIVVACNTATAAAIDLLRRRYAIPFVGMEPAVKPAALNTQTGHIGILATEGTFKGRLYRETSQRYAADVQVHIQVGKGLVDLVESGDLRSSHARDLLHTYLDPMLEQGIDQLVLGCTHYPFLQPLIETIVGPGVKVIDPAPAVARRVREVVQHAGSTRNHTSIAKHAFFTSGELKQIQSLLQHLMLDKAADFGNWKEELLS